MVPTGHFPVGRSLMGSVEQAEVEQLLGGPPRVTYEDIASHPRMPEARRAYLDRVLELYGDNPFMVRLLHQAGRFFVFHLALILEAAQDPERRETWVTVGLLKEKMAMLGVASGRQVDHLVARLCEVGFLEARASDQDRRLRIISTTEKLRAHDRDWLVAHYAGLALLYPQHDYGLIMRRDPAFQMLLRTMGPLLIPVGAKLMASTPHMMLFFQSAGTYPVFVALMLAAMAQPDNPHVAVPYADVGDRFGLSRTHVRTLLTSLEKEGLVKLHARGGHRVEILPHYWTIHDRGIAVGMYIHDILHQMATKAMMAQSREASRTVAAGSLSASQQPL
jgi:DNA-binding MarR family transcriptional regulator